MQIKTKDITVYSLNPEIYKSRAFYITEMREMGIFKDVKRIAFNYKYRDRVRTITMAHIYALGNAMDESDFPILLLEDDARIRKPLPDVMDIPDECKLMYLGGSNYNCGPPKPNMYLKDYNSSFYRVYYMLSAHAILIPNKEGAKLIASSYVTAIFKGIFNDVSLSLQSQDNVFLTPKDGLYFLQDDNSKHATDFDWERVKNKYIKR